LTAALAATDFDPLELERIEERLFALRAAARKYSTPVDGLAALAAKYAADVVLIDAGAEQLKKLEAAASAADARYAAAAAKLSAARTKAAEKLNRAVLAELAPLKLEEAEPGRPRRARPAQARARQVHDPGRQRRAGAGA
jgi:DNA repair protein RecN (Recombination protein N)